MIKIDLCITVSCSEVHVACMAPGTAIAPIYYVLMFFMFPGFNLCPCIDSLLF